jgi:PAS domain S-box-containing protein
MRDQAHAREDAPRAPGTTRARRLPIAAAGDSQAWSPVETTHRQCNALIGSGAGFVPKRIPVSPPFLLVLAGVVIDVTIGQLVRNVFEWPFYLDSIGTVLAGALAGPLVGALTGALANISWGLIFNDSNIIPYAITAACIGVAAGIAASLGAFKRPLWAALAGLITGVMAALVSAPISADLLGGSGGGGGQAVQERLRETGANALQAASLQGFISDPFDKAVTYLIVWLILLRLPATIRQRFALADSGGRSLRSSSRYGVALVLSVLALIFAVAFLPAFGRSVYAVFYIAVVLSAWNGGLGPAFVATGIGAAAAVLLPLYRSGSNGLKAEDWLSLCIFLTVSFLIALITSALDRTNRALNTALVEQRRSEAETRAVVDSVVEALLLVSPEQRLVSVNRRFEELFGLPANEVTGSQIDDLRPLVEHVFADPDAVATRVGSTVDDTGAHVAETYAQIWPQERQLELFSAPVRSDGTFLGRLFGFRDVTHERELDRMKTEFVSQVSHELRTPLTAIKGFTDMMLDGDAGDINEEQAEYLQIVKQNADRLVTLINDLLDVARIESGRIKLKIEPIDLGAIVASVVATLRPLVEGKDQSLSVEIEPGFPKARGDHDRVLQVVTNLVSNAHKYTPAGGAIRVVATHDGGLAQIAVRDTGIGISPEDVARLFTRFFRVDSSLTREIGGTGLGLSIVKSIVELHGGTVSVDSTPGQGSTFSFTLPLTETAAVETAPAAPLPLLAEPVAEPDVLPAAAERTILVVGDDQAVTAAISDRLGHAGYRVETACSAEDALGRIGEQQPDLVVLSVRMPGGHGLNRTSRLTEAPELRDVPLLVVSLLGDEPIAAALTTAEPVDQEQLLQHVHRALGESERRRVLVIEDDPSVRDYLSIALRKQEFEVLVAPDGETGLALAGQEHPATILLDLRLPGIDGFTVLQALKRSPDTAEIPVIVVTGSDGLLVNARARVLSLGAADFVAKPFEMDALVEEIRTLMPEEEVHHVDSRAGR